MRRFIPLEIIRSSASWRAWFTPRDNSCGGLNTPREFLTGFTKTRPGYALLLGVLLLTFMVVIALSIPTLVWRQTRISTRLANTIHALAAADSGIERALY